MVKDNEEDNKNKGKMTVEEAGKKGGEAVVEKYGPEHMAEIGRKGGEAPHEERGLEAADEETKERVDSEGGKASHKND